MGIWWEDEKHSAQSAANGTYGNGDLICRCAGTGVPRKQVSVTETPPTLVPSKNLLGISPSFGWVSRLGPHRGAQEVSHCGREIDGLEVWAATVTGSLQDGCGFADRESAAWTCQRCRSEVSTGEPGPPRPPGSRLSPTRDRHLLSISCPLAQGGGRELRPPFSGSSLTIQSRHRGQRRQREKD